jgi:gamma-glutamyltranspeptidase / glutathione hydrolase
MTSLIPPRQLLTLVLLSLAACVAPKVPLARDTGARTLATAATPTGINGAVATSESNATVAALSILQDGGNAVDAAIAASFALSVTYPAAGNLGGGGFFVYRAPDGASWFLDFRETAPAAATAAMYLDEEGEPNRAASTVGWRAAGVPGSVFGMWQAHQRWGSLPWKELVRPAIHLAERGYAVSQSQADSFNRAHLKLAEDSLAAKVFTPVHGGPWAKGDRLVQAELAGTLQAIADQGVAAFRSGPIVEQTVAASTAGGGILQAEDFLNYQPALRPLHTISWQGLEILVPTGPSSGALFLHQTLFSLENQPLAEWGFRDPRTVQLIGEATAAAFRDRNRWMGDPDSQPFEWQQLIDPQYMVERRHALKPDQYTAPDDRLPTSPLESTETTHYSILDGLGGAVSVTTTLNGGYGAKVMAPGGFMMNNEMDDFAAAPGQANQFGLVQGEFNAVYAGRRPLSSMCPVIVTRNGKVDAVFGSPGGPTILTTVLQVLLARYEFELSPEEAVAAKRFHRQDRPPVLGYEAGRLGRPTRMSLEKLGQPVKLRGSIGDVNGIFRDGAEWAAVADPRREGMGLVWLKSESR